MVNIRPYRYPPNQKDVTEQMVNNLLDTDVVRHSHIPFSSPIVMGVATNPKKIQAMKAWPVPTNINQLRGFLGLTGYYISTTTKGHQIAFLSRTLAPKHQSLFAYEKQLLAVRITTPLQSKWLPKLLSFDYEIDYKKGKENVVANALSRVQSQGKLFSLLSEVTTTEFIDVVTLLWTTNPVLSKVIQGLQDGTISNNKYT
ncbi:hypothetical protein Tco_0911649 [Tanacetum coccineum]|uniref:Reverse transcriptase RNase H-like domain-containing protein n=1 Tax=Tanacetum coccineum TaxID=301880 RepID=A0ABQ5D3I1_9ASTR